MSAPTKTVETPIGKNKVEIKEWITGREREYINEPMYNAVNPTTKQIGGKQEVHIGDVKMKEFITESTHREIEKFVVSVDGKTEDILDTVLDMHEEDTEFVTSQINEISKKKGTPTTS